MSLPNPFLGLFEHDPKRIIVDNNMDPSLQDVEIAWQYAHDLFDHWPGVRDTNQEVEAEIGAFLLTCPMSVAELVSYLRNNPRMSRMLSVWMAVFFPLISKKQLVVFENLHHGCGDRFAELILLPFLDEINRFRFPHSLRVSGTSRWSRLR